jgi:hypothetical protein
MANPSRRQRSRTNRLFVETFERRDLLSASHHLLDALSPTFWSAVLDSMQTNDWTPHILRIVDQYAAKGPQDFGLFTVLGKDRPGPHGLDGLAGAVLGSNDLMPPDVLTQDGPGPVETANSTIQDSPDSASQTTDSTDAGSNLDSTLATLTISPTLLIGDVASDHHVLSVATTAASTTVDPLSLLNQIGNITVLPMPVTTITKGHGYQSGTTPSSTNDGNVSQSDASQSTVADDSVQGHQTTNDATTGSSATVGTFLASTLNDDPSGSMYSLPSESSAAASSLLSTTPYGVDSTSAGAQTNIGLNSLSANARASAGDSAGRDHSNIHSAAVDARATIVHEAYFSNAQDLAHGRADSYTALNRIVTDGATMILSKSRSAENLTDLDHLSLLSDRVGGLDAAFSLSDQDSGATADSRRDSPLEVTATDLLFGRATRLTGEQAGADGQGDEEVAASPVNASAHGAGLLGSPLLFDLDSLAQEAQEFFTQIEQMGQDLAGLLGRSKLIAGLVAISLAASAIEVARRRNKRAAHGIVLQGCTGTTFTCYPNLGGTWTWEES